MDSGHHDNARALFATVMDLAPHNGYQMASAMRHAGIQMIDAGAYNDGLKAYQLGQVASVRGSELDHGDADDDCHDSSGLGPGEVIAQ